MKKCPTCDKTFEDSMRFCQVDGTPLVDDAPAFDPYATVVAPRQEVLTPVADPEPVGIDEVSIELSAAEPSTPAIAEPDEVLDLPQSDPLKTMYVSEDEMRAALGNTSEPEEQIMEIPPVPMPEPPKFVEPELEAPNFGSVTPPPSPFDASPPPPAVEPDYSEPATMIQPEMPAFQAAEPVTPPYMEPEPAAPVFNAPFEPQQSDVQAWTPPPAPDASWQNQEIGQNTPFQPPVGGTEGANKTLAIISLVTGILSLFCCGWFVPGIAALVMGFIARGKANSDPAQYGGAGLALGGMITGGVSIVLGIIVVALYMLGFAASLMR